MPNTSIPSDMQRARDLCLLRCEAELSRDESEELCRLLQSSEEIRKEYWRLVTIHAELHNVIGDIEAAATSPFNSTSQIDSATRLGGTHNGKTATIRTASPRLDSGLLAWLAIAASLAFALWIWRTPDDQANFAAQNGESLQRQSTPLGQIQQLVAKSSWSFGRSGADNSTTVFEGDTLYLNEGALELHLATNTVAQLEAPAILQTVSMDRFRLIRGNVKVDVAKGDEGFAVETASAEVIDLGTVFSVGVDHGKTDLVVYDGEVDLLVANHSDQTNKMPKRFYAGEAVQVKENGTLSRIIQVQQTKVSTGSSAVASQSVISSVRDDNMRDDFWRFYEIVPGGMFEDAQAFVDRPHQWNGESREGLPAYLKGGDYVKTFNDDKVTNEIQIEITLEQPAELYVLLDTRVTPPEWLLEVFEPTGDVIGVDEVSYPYNETKARPGELAVGPGRSINRTHTVWKLVAPNAGTIKLGANGSLIDDTLDGVKAYANMYGIVAVPLSEAF